MLVVGPRRVILHYVSLTDPLNELHDIARVVPGLVEIGIAVNPDVDRAKIDLLLEERLISFVQCMGLSKLGVQGTAFDEAVFKKTCENVSYFREKYPEMAISVDGGVNLDTAAALVEAGATRLVCGSAVFSSGSIVNNIARLKAVI